MTRAGAVWAIGLAVSLGVASPARGGDATPALPGAPLDGRCADDLASPPDGPCLDVVSGLIRHPAFAFEIDKARLRPASVDDVRALAVFLNAHPEVSWLEIRAHSDVPPRYGRRLTDDRARAILEALADFGVARERLTAKGYGDSQPLYPPKGPDRAKNRRVALHVLGWRGEDVPSLQRRCLDHSCARDGGCRSVRGRCVPRSDDDCRAATICPRDGGCSAVEGRCGPVREADCRAAAACREEGRCALRDGYCVAGSDADCAASRVCEEAARCTALRGTCQIGSDADCARTETCRERGLCSWSGYGCRAGEHADCAASERCRAVGRCVYDAGRMDCVAGPGWCPPSEACTRYGQCTLSGGRCVAARAADCRQAPGCAAEGRCVRSPDGRCVVSRRSCRRSAVCRDEGRCVPHDDVCVPAAER